MKHAFKNSRNKKLCCQQLKIDFIIIKVYSFTFFNDVNESCYVILKKFLILVLSFQTFDRFNSINLKWKMLILTFINFIIMKFIHLTFSRIDFFVNFTIFNTHCFMFVAAINYETWSTFYIHLFWYNQFDEVVCSRSQYFRDNIEVANIYNQFRSKFSCC